MIKDLTNMKFGKLTVIKKVGINSHGHSLWLCQCECGNEKTIMRGSLIGGRTKSCGCLKKECSEETRRKMSEKRKGRKHTEESKAKMRGRKQTEESKHKRSEALKGKPKTKEHKRKLSESRIGKYKGENNPHYKGGITPITNYLRHMNIVEDWFISTKKQANFICQLTNKPSSDLHTHHLYSFSNIVENGHNKYGITIKNQVKDYTSEELELLENYVATWHKDNSNAIVLCKDVHFLFHKLYGKGNNTPEQYIEFKERYLAGEFKEILK